MFSKNVSFAGLPTEIHTHINSYDVSGCYMFGYALFLIYIEGTRAKYLSRLLVLVSLGASMRVVL